MSQKTESNRSVNIKRTTKETDISLSLHIDNPGKISLDLPLPFLSHMFNAMAYHGGFGLDILATGDIDVDPHHLVEDLGIVLGQAFLQIFEKSGAITRYGFSSIPMDDALSQVTIDVCNRAYLVYNPRFPQDCSGTFPMFLFKDFFQSFAVNAKINLHLDCRYGENSHHMIEALFKALGKALKTAYSPSQLGSDATMSTKGLI